MAVLCSFLLLLLLAMMIVLGTPILHAFISLPVWWMGDYTCCWFLVVCVLPFWMVAWVAIVHVSVRVGFCDALVHL